MTTIQYKLTNDTEELVKMATSNNKNRHLFDHKMVYMDACQECSKIDDEIITQKKTDTINLQNFEREDEWQLNKKYFRAEISLKS